MADKDSVYEGIKAFFNEMGGQPTGNSTLSEAKAAPPSGATASLPNLENVSDGLFAFTQALTSAATGIYSFADSTNAFANAMAVAAKIPLIGGAIGPIAGMVDAGREHNIEASKQGIGGSFTGLNLQAAHSGQTIADFTKGLANTAGTLNGFGATAAGVAANYAEVNKLALESEMGRQLIRNGFSAEEMNRYVQLAGLNSKANLSELGDRQKLAKSAVELAMEIDATSRITGKNRETITDEMTARDKTAEGILTMNLLSKEQQDQYKHTQTQLSGMGNTIQDAALNLSSGQALTDDTIATLGALGPAGTAFQNAIAQAQAATTEAEKTAAHAAMERAKADIVTYTTSKEYSALALSGGAEINEQQRKLAVETNAFAQSMKGVSDKHGVSTAQAGQVATTIVTAAQKGETVTGEKIEGTEITSEINDAYEGARKQAVLAALEFDKLNISVGGTTENITELRKAFQLFGDSTKTSANQSLASSIKTVQEAVTPSATVSYPNLEGHIPGTLLEEPIKRQDGSFGATGSLLEDFSKYGAEGAPAVLHGKEGVITEAQLRQLASNKLSKETVAGSEVDQASPIKPTVSNGADDTIVSAIGKEASAMFGSIQMPDLTSIGKEASAMFGNIQMPDLTSIGNDASAMFGNIQMPDFDSVVGQMKAPDFTKLPMFGEIEKAPQLTTPPPPVEAPVAPPSLGEQQAAIGIKDLYDVLVDLNTNILQMVSHTAEINDSSKQTAGYASESTGSRV